MKGKVKKLAKLCERIFIFIDEEEPMVPFDLVRKLQTLGKKVKWVPVEIDLQSDFQVFFSFFVGQAHEKVAPDVEFILLGVDAQYDSLVRHLNTSGRSCLRLDASRACDLLEPQPPFDAAMAPAPVPAIPRNDIPAPAEEPSESGKGAALEKPDPAFEKIAEDIVQRMIRSGNRPAELTTLREYIRLCHQELKSRGSIDQIIQYMQQRKEIAVNGGQEVVYHF